MATSPDDVPQGIDLDTWKRWTPAAQERFLEMLRTSQEPGGAWYCQVGRSCDGKPHPGAMSPHARGAQWPPPGSDWLAWLLASGRGTGKTRSAAEYTRKVSEHVSRIALIAATGPDARDTMIEGESGLLQVCARAGKPASYEPSKRKVTFYSGAQAHVYSAEEPDRLRGPQHGFAWLDEPAHWPLVVDVWDNLLLGLRLGARPHVVATTTPLPIKWLKELLKDPTSRVTRESTYDNIDNLPQLYRDKIISKYEGTRLGRQELYGEILEDVEGALWTQALILAASQTVVLPDHYDRVVVGVDPAGTSKDRSDETGIIVLGILDGIVYVIADYSGKYTPNGWASKVAFAYEAHHADVVVAENNYGGEMVAATLRNARQMMRVQEVNSRRGKLIRAEPVVALYEQNRIKHGANLTDLEEQQLSWVPGKGSSPDRVDALVHGVHALVRTERPAAFGRVTAAPMRSLASVKIPRANRILAGVK